ncbi:MAG: hypothetical protein ACM3PP_09560 [Candidatus Saccharibacteria bacterium]
MKRFKALGLIIVLVLVLTLQVGCGGSNVSDTSGTKNEAQSDSSAVIDTSKLLTKADVEAVLGAPAKEQPVKTNVMNQKIYFFEPVKQGTQVRFVQLSVVQTSEMPEKLTKYGTNAKSLFADTTKMIEGATPVPGIGDKAVWGGHGLKMGSGLHILKGDVYLNIDVGLGDGPKDLEAEKKLAKIVLDRM